MTKKTDEQKPPVLIKLTEVKRMTTLSTSEIYRRLAKGEFPKQVRLGAKSVAWLEHEVQAWVASMIDGRHNEPELDAA